VNECKPLVAGKKGAWAKEFGPPPPEPEVLPELPQYPGLPSACPAPPRPSLPPHPLPRPSRLPPELLSNASAYGTMSAFTREINIGTAAGKMLPLLSITWWSVPPHSAPRPNTASAQCVPRPSPAPPPSHSQAPSLHSDS
jgi:hypothetical protein